MVKDSRKFYLYDRWFYFEKETEEKIIYKSNTKKRNRSITIEVDKNNNDTDVLYFSDDKLISKLEIREVNSDNIQFHYKDQEAQYIQINNETYANLLVELFTSYNEKLINKKTVKITKKRNKKDIVYREPEDFKLDKEISLNKIKIESKVLSYFLGLIDYIKTSGDLLDISYFINDSNIIDTNLKIEKIKNLEVPSELYVYDRNYTFINRDDDTLYYENKQEGINSLEIKIDPNNILTAINMRMKNKTSTKNTKYVFQIKRNECGGLTVRFGNGKKGPLRITNNSSKDYDDASFRYTQVYDNNGKKISNKLDIKAGKEEFELSGHPYFSNSYVDEEGNEYRIGSQDFAKLDGMAHYAPGIFSNIEKTLVKE